MSKVILDVSMSLDGFIAGPNIRPAEPMGDGGEDLHTWMGGDRDVDANVRREVDGFVGATLIGRRTFDLGLSNWGGTPWPGIPAFIVTHRPERDFVGDNSGTFSFGSLDYALRKAKQAAGDRNVLVMGADLSRQMFKAGLLDEIYLHISPILLGGGERLFDGHVAGLIPESTAAGNAAHLRLRVAKPA